MKYFYVILFVLLMTGCSKVQNVEFLGSTPGIDSGSVLIKNINDSVFLKADIRAGKFHLKQKFDAPVGYYNLIINKNSMGTVGAFDFYFENGTYNITTNPKYPFKYPDVHSTSKKENNLAIYYHVSDSVSTELIKKVTDLTAQLNNKSLPPAAKDTLSKQLNDAKTHEASALLTGLDVFVTKYPDNEIASHIMLNINYQADPVSFYKVYQKFSKADKNSSSGQELAHWLNYYIAKPLGK